MLSSTYFLYSSFIILTRANLIILYQLAKKGEGYPGREDDTCQNMEARKGWGEHEEHPMEVSRTEVHEKWAAGVENRVVNE